MLVLVFLSAAPAVFAQQTSSIAGVVKDSSGGVLPGVTVEASSPALIEKVRTATTDGEGRYNIVDIPPGTYTVTFTLGGFGVFKREGLQIPSGFTATVDGTMRVGALEESITVSGAAPLVDTANVRKQLVASADMLSALPTSSKQIYTLVTLTPGYTGVTDVGGQYAAEAGSYHGKYGTKVSFNGMGIENSSGNSSYQINAATVDEMVLQTSGISAEVNADGPVMNIVPKSGGNTFQGILNGLYSNHSMESDNLTDELRARGLQNANKRVKIFDEAASLGGPIKKDKIWFFGAFRTWGMAKQFAGTYYNKTQDQALTPPGAFLRVVPWTPWVDRPLDTYSSRWESYDSYSGRVTWQMAPKHKLDVYVDDQHGCNCGSIGSTYSVESYVGSYKFEPNVFTQINYNSPITSKLLLEAGYGASISQWNQTYGPNVTPDIVSIFDAGTSLIYGNYSTYRGRPDYTNRRTQRFAATYVTGTHTFKSGFQSEQLGTDQFIFSNGNMSYIFFNGTPISLTQYTTPYGELDRGNDLGIFAQDQWRLGKMTLNLGVRFDHFVGYAPAQDVPGQPDSGFDVSYPGVATAPQFPNQWIGARHFDRVDNIPNWSDINPRLGVAYDLFGNGRTALKASIGRYVAKTNVDVAQQLNPINTSINSATRSWSDANHNFIPDCNLADFTSAVNGECGALGNQNFGKTNPNAISWADSVREGWGVRDSNWDMSAELQQELRKGLSLTGGYYRNTGGYYRNATAKGRVTDNTLVTPSDYSQYCVTAPQDPRLPGGGGYPICGMSDINPNRFGQSLVVVSPASDYGEIKRVNDFFSVALDARLSRGVRLGGGFDTGRTVNDQCFTVDAPGIYAFPSTGFGGGTYVPFSATTINGQSVCRVVTPFKGQTQLKLNGSYPIKAGFVVSGVYQDLSGPAIEASWSAPNSAIAPSLGRNLSGNAATARVPLIAPQTMFEGRIRRLDLRVTKIFNLPRHMRFQANLDAYNALNGSAIQVLNTTFGTSWLQPFTILDPRILQVSGQFNF
jgi:hypothetical protein